MIFCQTLSPLDMYPKMLDFDTIIMESVSIKLARNCILPVVVSKGQNFQDKLLFY